MPAIGFSFFMMGLMFGAGYLYSNILISVTPANANKIILTTEEFENLTRNKDLSQPPPSYGATEVDPLLEL